MSHSKERGKMPPFEVKKTPEEFFKRLAPQDAWSVLEVLKTVKGLTKAYEEDFWHQDGFFSVYAIGGHVTKPGNRPDIDLLVATNTYFTNGFIPVDDDFLDYKHGDYIYQTGDWVIGVLAEDFGKKNWKVEPVGTLPPEYMVGATGKALLRLTPPKLTEKKPLDIVCVNTRYIDGIIRPSDRRTLSSAQFERSIDVDSSGAPLPRIKLYDAFVPKIQYKQ